MYVTGEFKDAKPAIFKREELKGLVYYESRRSRPDIDVLSGNISTTDAVLGEENYLRSESTLEYTAWRQIQLGNVATRLKHVRSEADIEAIGYMRTDNDLNLINLDRDMHTVSIDTPFAGHATSSASILTRDGFGSLYAASDFAVATLAFPGYRGAGAVIQTHVSPNSAVSGLIPRTLERATAIGIDVSDGYGYIGPHLGKYQLDKIEAEEVYEAVSQQDDTMRKDFLQNITLGESGHPILDIDGIIQQQLVRSGIAPVNIQISKTSTAGNRNLFSRKDHTSLRQVNGKFGVLAGKTRQN